MANTVQKFIYYISAAVPLLFVFSVLWSIQKKDYGIPLSCICIGLLLLLLLYISFVYGKKHLPVINIRTSQISPNDGWVIGYIISYMVPFTNIVFDDFDLIVCGLIAMVIIIFLPFVNTSMPNPLLMIARYHFYQVSAENGVSGYILISKRKLRRKQDLRIVNRIFEFLLLDAEEV